MPSILAPEPILRAALKVLHVAAYTTQNWTIGDEVSRKQINDLWEAIHPIPEVIKRWRSDGTSLTLLRMYMREYNDKWESPKLEEIFDLTLKNPDL